jgi:hypothetical protein
MTRSESPAWPLWRGLPLVTELRLAFPRSRVTVCGTIVSVLGLPDGRSSIGYRCVLDDGTGQIDLLFLGRDRVDGVSTGARCHIEGTAMTDHGRLSVWHPLYRLELPDRDEDGRTQRSLHG